jgi:hypothetical protein
VRVEITHKVLHVFTLDQNNEIFTVALNFDYFYREELGFNNFFFIRFLWKIHLRNIRQPVHLFGPCKLDIVDSHSLLERNQKNQVRITQKKNV